MEALTGTHKGKIGAAQIRKFNVCKKELAAQKKAFKSIQKDSHSMDPAWHSSPAQKKSLAKATGALKVYKDAKKNVEKCCSM